VDLLLLPLLQLHLETTQYLLVAVETVELDVFLMEVLEQEAPMEAVTAGKLVLMDVLAAAAAAVDGQV
jgi:hypothetical protein